MNIEEERKAYEEWFKDHSKDWPFPSESIKCIARDNDWLVWLAAKEHAAEMAKPAARIEKDPYGHWWIKWAGHAEGKYESAEAATAEALKQGFRITYTGSELPE